MQLAMNNPELEKRFLEEDPECDVVKGRVWASQFNSYYEGLMALNKLREEDDGEGNVRLITSHE